MRNTLGTTRGPSGSMQPIKRIATLVVVVLAASVIAACSSATPSATSSAVPPANPPVRVRAVYLESTVTPQLGAGDLSRHPEVLVVRSQAELDSRLASGEAIWIDKGVAHSLDVDRLREMTSGRVLPVALIGYNSSLFAFRETLPIPRSRFRLEPGFAVFSFRRLRSGGTESYLRGYDVTPTVDAVLAATDPILRGKFPGVEASAN